jgi:ubiquinone/menaquinone biosynthesis C-methylase UbiE
MDKNYSSIELETKKVYIEQHKNFLRDETIFNRHLAVAENPNTYDLPKSFFSGKKVLDAGCGNSGYFEVAMYKLGVDSVTCMDIGNEWQEQMEIVLYKNQIPKGFCKFESGSTILMPFEDESFDFVVSYGVLMHLETVEMASSAISELARVARKPGVVYSHIGVDKPGIVDRYIIKALRSAYQEDQEFKEFIDTLDFKSLNSELSQIYNKCKMYDQRLSYIPEDFLSSLITLDSTTFWQNWLQVPVQNGPFLSEDWGRTEMAKNGLVNIRRPSETYWLRNDFRRFLAPIHFCLDSPLAKLLYGNGHVKLTGEKN